MGISFNTINFIMYAGFMKIIIILQILYLINHFTVFISSSSIYAYSY